MPLYFPDANVASLCVSPLKFPGLIHKSTVTSITKIVQPLHFRWQILVGLDFRLQHLPAGKHVI
jgi:hypothetical protein